MFSNVPFWDISPYVTLAVLVVGTWWRYRYDKFGWTSRSSQFYESRLLRIGSPIFHFGILAVFAGHVMGLFIPPRVTHLLKVSDYAYHLQAVIAGSIAGFATLAGIGLLMYRRFTRPAVSMATTRSDKVMYVVLSARHRGGPLLRPDRHRAAWRGVPLPLHGRFVVPADLAAAAARGGHGQRPIGLPAARPDRHGAVHHVAVYPAGARLQRADRLHGVGCEVRVTTRRARPPRFHNE